MADVVNTGSTMEPERNNLKRENGGLAGMAYAIHLANQLYWKARVIATKPAASIAKNGKKSVANSPNINRDRSPSESFAQRDRHHQSTLQISQAGEK